jgi:FtsH-binding integral membrane protein
MSDPRFPTSATGPAGAAGQTAGTGAARQVLEGSLPPGAGVVPDARLRTAFLGQAFVWMFVGLIVSAGIAYVVQTNVTLLRFAYENTFILLIAQVALVVAISWGINKISAIVALTLFFVYAASMGLTLGVIVAAYTAGGESASVVTAFLSAAAMFGAAAIYGAVTKRSLAKMGGILFMGLIGLIVASVLNIFLGSSGLTWIISIVGVVIFAGLTAWDVQRIQNGQLAIYTGSMEKAAVIGALTLYLDFINIFLFMLRLFGGNR